MTGAVSCRGGVAALLRGVGSAVKCGQQLYATSSRFYRIMGIGRFLIEGAPSNPAYFMDA